MHSQADLLEVVDALDAAGRLAGRLHGGQQQGDQHGDDGDDDQQLDQRETGSAATALHRFILVESHSRGCRPTDAGRALAELGEPPCDGHRLAEADAPGGEHAGPRVPDDCRDPAMPRRGPAGLHDRVRAALPTRRPGPEGTWLRRGRRRDGGRRGRPWLRRAVDRSWVGLAVLRVVLRAGRDLGYAQGSPPGPPPPGPGPRPQVLSPGERTGFVRRPARREQADRDGALQDRAEESRGVLRRDDPALRGHGLRHRPDCGCPRALPTRTSTSGRWSRSWAGSPSRRSAGGVPF